MEVSKNVKTTTKCKTIIIFNIRYSRKNKTNNVKMNEAEALIKEYKLKQSNFTLQKLWSFSDLLEFCQIIWLISKIIWNLPIHFLKIRIDEKCLFLN